MRKRLIVTPERCVNCRSCEVACSFTHAGEANKPAVTRIRVYTFSEERNVPVTCLQCEEAACMTVCPTGALSRNPETLAVDYNEEKCIRCKSCVYACPFGNCHFDAAYLHIAKCDLCGGDPACARFCPSGALVFDTQPPKGEINREDAPKIRMKFTLPVP